MPPRWISRSATTSAYKTSNVEVASDPNEGGKKGGRRSTQEGPGGLSNPTLVRQRAIEHDDAGGARIEELFGTRKPGSGTTPTGQGGRGGGTGTRTGPLQPLSFDEERRGGGKTSAEFHAVPGRDAVPMHFELFMQWFREKIEHKIDWKLHFTVESLGNHIPECQPADRLILFARVKTPNTVGYLVELEPLQGQLSYTLVVIRRINPESTTVKEVGARLKKWLKESGRSHVTEILKDDLHFQVMLATHRDLGSDNWVTRILEKIEPPDRRPSWTRGVAG